LIIKLILIAFIVYEFYTIFSRKHPIVSIKTALNNNGGISPFNMGFNIAIGITTQNISLKGYENLATNNILLPISILDPSYGTIYATYDTITTNESG
jgi:hypothetical protein